MTSGWDDPSGPRSPGHARPVMPGQPVEPTQPTAVAPPFWSQPAPQDYGQRQAWGQHASEQSDYLQPAYGQAAWGQQSRTVQDTRTSSQHPPRRDNPYQVTPAQYYRDQGYAEAEPAPPAPQPVQPGTSAWDPYRRRASTLGIAAFAVVAGMLGVCLVSAQALVRAYSTILMTLGTLEIQNSDVTDELAAPLVGPSSVIGLASLVGFVGLVLGIVAAVTRRGRAWGAAAITLGIFAPGIWGTMVAMGLMPVVAQLAH